MGLELEHWKVMGIWIAESEEMRESTLWGLLLGTGTRQGLDGST